MQNYCLKYAKQVEITKTNKKNLSFNSCKFLFVIFLVLLYILLLSFYRSFSIVLQSDAIFVLSGTKNDIAGQKTISRDISFLCHRVIALIKAQVCDKYIYIYTICGIVITVGRVLNGRPEHIIVKNQRVNSCDQTFYYCQFRATQIVRYSSDKIA